MISRIQQGEFTSVTKHNEQIYAATVKGTTSMIYVYRFSKNFFNKWSWKVELKFSIVVGNVSLCTTDSEIMCCSSNDHKIAMYTLTGQLRPVYGSFGSVEAGQMNSPYTCYIDDECSLLIADHSNHRLQVMQTTGEFSVLELKPPVLQPRSAVLLDSHIYVTSEDMMTISKFQQMTADDIDTYM